MAIRIDIETNAAQREVNKLRKELIDLGVSSDKASDKAKALEDRLSKKFNADQAARALDSVKRSSNLSRIELAALQTQSGNMSGALKTLGVSSQSAAKLIGTIGTAAVAATVAAGAAFGALAVKSIGKAGEFQTALVDMAKVTDEPLSEIRRKIQAIDPALGNSTELVKGYYQVISAGVTDPAQSLEVLKTAAMTAKTAHVEQSEVVKGITKVMAAYAKENTTAAQAADLLFAMEKAGQTSVQELIPYIGELSAKSAALGISQTELGAAFGAVTKLAGSTAEASTQYRAIMTSLMTPSKEMTDLLGNYGGAQKAIADMGFEGVLRKIAEAAGGDASELAKLMGSAESLSGVIAISANDFDAFSASMEVMEGRAGSLDQAWKNHEGTYEAVKEKFDNTIKNLMIELGEVLLPIVTQKLDEFALWFQNNKDTIVAAFETMVNAGVAFANVVTKVFSFFSENQETAVAAMESRHAKLKEYIEYYDNASWFSKFVSSGNVAKAKEELAGLERQMAIVNGQTDSMGDVFELVGSQMSNYTGAIGRGLTATEGLKAAEAALLEESRKLAEQTGTAGTAAGELAEKLRKAAEEAAKKKKEVAEAAAAAKKLAEETKKAAEAMASAYDKMYRDIGLEDDKAYDHRVRQIADEAEKFVAATGDQVTAAQWMQSELIKLENERDRVVLGNIQNRLDAAKSIDEQTAASAEAMFRRIDAAGMASYQKTTETNRKAAQNYRSTGDEIAKTFTSLSDGWNTYENARRSITGIVNKWETGDYGGALADIAGAAGRYLPQVIALFGGKAVGEAAEGGSIAVRIAKVAAMAATLGGAYSAVKRAFDDGGRVAAYAAGGWLDRNPGGGPIREGSHRYDDVFLGFRGGAYNYGMGGEWIINQADSRRQSALLDFINSGGFGNYDGMAVVKAVKEKIAKKPGGT